MVVSDIPGLAEAITPGVGARVPVGDTHAVAGALTRRLADADLRSTEGQAAALAAKAFDVRHTHDRLATITAQLARCR